MSRPTMRKFYIRRLRLWHMAVDIKCKITHWATSENDTQLTLHLKEHAGLFAPNGTVLIEFDEQAYADLRKLVGISEADYRDDSPRRYKAGGLLDQLSKKFSGKHLHIRIT